MSSAAAYTLANTMTSATAGAGGGADISAVPCEVIKQVADALKAIIPGLVGVMFLFGAAKYIYSADDPGGRKQAKSMINAAVIGAILAGTLELARGAIRGGTCGIL